jgi:hypothetical protein
MKIAAVVLCLAALLALENALVGATMHHLPRLATDFSPAYLDRELSSLASEPPRVVLLGDSVLWGYRVAQDRSAAARLASRNVSLENLAFKTANPASDLFLLRLMDQRGVKPKLVVLELNLQVFNPFDQSYRAIHPAVATLAWPFVGPGDVRALHITPPAGWQASLEPILEGAWLLYAMRSDVRETLVPPAEAPLPPLTPDMFTMTYDQAPLRPSNLEVKYLTETADFLRSHAIPAIAFLTPVNHQLLHEFIDNEQYAANKRTVARVLQQRGITVLDWDAALPGGDFFDNDHLNLKGQDDLAALLAKALGASPQHGNG